MKKKILSIVFCTLLLANTLFIVNNHEIVTAIDGGDKGEQYLNFTYIHNIAQTLSDIVTDPQYPKARAYGTSGEHYAASLIEDWMEDIGLYNVKTDKIQNISSSLYNEDFLEGLTTAVKVDDCKIYVNDTELIEGHIRPAHDFSILRLFGPRYADLDELYNVYYSWKLTRDIEYSGLRLYPTPSHNHLIDFLNDRKDEILNSSADSFLEWVEYLIPEYEEYYNFNFSVLTESNAPELLSEFWNYTPWCENNCGDGFLFIEEDPAFNPNAWSYPDWLKVFKYFGEIRHVGNILEMLIYKLTLWRCKGIIRYDFHEDTYDMEYQYGRPLPTIYINGSIGTQINNSRPDYRIRYILNQTWETDIESYNVIGQINGTNPDNTTIVACLYDCWWNQGTADSAIGMGMVLAIARYMKNLEENYNIQPRNTVKFIGFAGEEQGLRGAYYYDANQSDENIVTMIDLNQLGFTQNPPDSRLSLDVVVPESIIDSTWAISDDTNYVDRTDNVTDFDVVDVEDWFYNSDYKPFAKNESRDTVTLSFVKNMGWVRHHRTGEDHSKGDVMSYFNWTDVNVTTEMIWNFTKYYTINPDCWFESVAYDSFDSPNDGDTLDDSVNISFEINSSLPYDKVMVKALLKNETNETMYENSEDYTITSSGSTNALILSIPHTVHEGEYSVYLELYNSTGRINDIVGIGSNNVDDSDVSQDTFHLYHALGYATKGAATWPLYIAENVSSITGSIFTANEYGEADNITAFVSIKTPVPAPKYQCMIYRYNDSELIGVTDEIDFSGKSGEEPPYGWVVFNFTSKPKLVKGVKYILSCWGNNTHSKLYCDPFPWLYYGMKKGWYNFSTYGTPPENPTFSSLYQLFSLYCGYINDTISPEIANISSTPVDTGYYDTDHEYYTNITADVTDDLSGVNTVMVAVDYPNNTLMGNYTMTMGTGDTFWYNLSMMNTPYGIYNYTIWVEDNANNTNVSGQYNVTVSICGDANGDGACNIGDSVYLIAYVYQSGPPPDPLCSGDANGDGGVNIGDSVYIIAFVYQSGPPPKNTCCPLD